MKKYYIGLDVHKDSVFMAVLDDRKVRSNQKADSDVIETREVPTNSPQLVKAIKGYQGKGKVFVAYEAGCLGFDLYHFLVADTVIVLCHKYSFHKSLCRECKGVRQHHK